MRRVFTDRKKVTFYLNASEYAELERRAKGNVSEYVRRMFYVYTDTTSVLVELSHDKEPPQVATVEAVAEKEVSGNGRADKKANRGGRRVSRERGIRVERPIRDVGATCEHGTKRGYHCWQCGGKAKVD